MVVFSHKYKFQDLVVFQLIILYNNIIIVTEFYCWAFVNNVVVLA